MTPLYLERSLLYISCFIQLFYAYTIYSTKTVPNYANNIKKIVKLYMYTTITLPPPSWVPLPLPPVIPPCPFLGLRGCLFGRTVACKKFNQNFRLFYKGTTFLIKGLFQKNFPYIFYVFSIRGLIIIKGLFPKKFSIYFFPNLYDITHFWERITLFICLFTLEVLVIRKRWG